MSYWRLAHVENTEVEIIDLARRANPQVGVTAERFHSEADSDYLEALSPKLVIDAMRVIASARMRLAGDNCELAPCAFHADLAALAEAWERVNKAKNQHFGEQR